MSIAALAALAACSAMDDDSPSLKNRRINFDISVTRDGTPLTRSAAEESDKLATMDEDIPFGLVAIDFEKGQLVLDNMKVGNSGGSYSTSFDGYMWNGVNKVSISAYYPYVDDVRYGDGFENYIINYSVNETEAGPLVSKTVERAIDQLNMVPLVFQHITSDIGYKICDITPDKNLQGLIHLRKLTATNVASAGVFVNDVLNSNGVWHKQGYYRKVVVFEGDAKVGVGSENEKFVGRDTLVDRMADSHRYYSIPDDIEVGKQYTFHIGLDLSSVYTAITFAPSVGDWETSIYENNEDF